MMVYKGPQEGRFFDMTDFLVICALWQKISDHPNIVTVHYVENINDVPFLGLEYVPCASLEQLISKDNFLFPEKYLRNMSVILKVIISICNALSYAHSMSVLHLNLKPDCVLWSVQDMLETKVMQITNPLDPDGIMLNEFGMQSTLDMRHQNFSTNMVQKDLSFIDMYWPPFVKRQFRKVIERDQGTDFDKDHFVFMKQLTPNIDIFCFGALLLYIVNCGYSWRSSDELLVNNVSSLLSRGNRFFHKPVYDKFEALIARCLMVFDPKFKG